MHEEWTDQLSEYLDGELPDAERRALESHLAQCEPCAAVLADLRRVVAQAGALPPRPPSADFWPQIAARIDPSARAVLPFARAAQDRSDGGFALRRAPVKVAFTIPQLAAAAVLLMAISGGLVWSLAGTIRGRAGATASTAAGPNAATTGRGSAADGFAGTQRSKPAADTPIDPSIADVSFADAQYDAAVAELQRAVLKGRGRLDANTVAIVEHNLQLIDQAIDQARQALASDPANTYLSSHLLEARRRKLDLLRRTAEMASESN